MNISDLYTIFINECNQIISTDTRDIVPGSLFFAWRGGQQDGNQYATEALEKGAQYVVIDNPDYDLGDSYILVTDSVEALGLLAQHHRRQFDIPVIGLTGSNGKTTTKELIASVLQTEKNIVAPIKSYNNFVGVSKTLLEIDADTEIAVIEMGANHVGEIAELCRIAEPTHGLITNIGRAHIGSFGGHENIVRGKTELYRFLEQADASSFVNGADRLLLTESNTTEKITYLSADSDYPVISKNTSPLVSCSWRDLDIQTQLTGEYNLSNIAVAIAVGDYFDVPAVNIKKGLEKYIPENNRSQIVQTDKKNTIIKDYYNANRSSMELALLNLANMNTEQEKIAILGDIGDLEDYSHDEHLAVINFALELDIQKIIVVGKEFSQVHVDSEKVTQYEHVDNALVDLQDMNIRNSIVLLKASRGPKPLPVFEVLFSDVDW